MRTENNHKLAELKELEILSVAIGLSKGPMWRGKKPKVQ